LRADVVGCCETSPVFGQCPKLALAETIEEQATDAGNVGHCGSPESLQAEVGELRQPLPAIDGAGHTTYETVTLEAVDETTHTAGCEEHITPEVGHPESTVGCPLKKQEGVIGGE